MGQRLASSSVVVFLLVGAPSAAQSPGIFPGTQFASGNSPYALVVADVNSDGHADVVTANYGASNTVSVQLGNGTGGIGAPANLSAGSAPVAVVALDMNGDGMSDLAGVGSNGGGDVPAALLNQSTAIGPFVPWISACSPFPSPVAALPTPVLTIDGAAFLGATQAAVGSRVYAGGQIAVANENRLRVTLISPLNEIGPVAVKVSTSAGTSSPAAARRSRWPARSRATRRCSRTARAHRRRRCRRSPRWASAVAAIFSSRRSRRPST